MQLSLQFCEAGINAVRRQNQTGRVQIRRRETELASQFVAFNHTSGNRVRPAQHLARGVQFARANRFANPRAADDPAVERNRRQSVNGKTDFTAKFFQQRDIAAAFVAENKIRADADAVDCTEVAGQAAEKIFAGLFAEFFVKAEPAANASAPSDSIARSFCGSE